MTCKENFINDIINKFYCCPVISSYIIKELKKLVSCLYGVIMHSGECWENTREACKTLRYASCFTSFSRILPTFPHRALLHHKGTRLVFYFLSNTNLDFQLDRMYVCELGCAIYMYMGCACSNSSFNFSQEIYRNIQKISGKHEFISFFKTVA